MEYTVFYVLKGIPGKAFNENALKYEHMCYTGRGLIRLVGLNLKYTNILSPA